MKKILVSIILFFLVMNFHSISAQKKNFTKPTAKKVSKEKVKNTDELFKKAVNLEKEKKFVEAIKIFEEILKLNTNFYNAHLHLGNIYFEIGDRNKVIYHYEKFLSLNPKFSDPDFHYKLGSVYLNKVQGLQKETKEYKIFLEKAISELKKVLEISIIYKDVHLLLGNAYELEGDFEKAKKEYETEIVTNPADHLGYLYLGILFKKKNMYRETIYILEKCVEINPKSYSAYFTLGESYEKIGNFDKGIECFEKAESLDNSNVAPIIKQAELYNIKKDLKKSIEKYQIAISKIENDEEKSKLQLIISNLQFHEATLKEMASLYTYIADFFFLSGKKIEAIFGYKRALEFDPDCKEAKKAIEILEGNK